ncbi:hypothetical protein AXF42_Ash018173 [Apostasia shenzhenica]|uniref:CRIB domain-containing protein n=1 Tax=Apostasia shenzhenica TaxID=1088818 RepID=A0A2I0AF60_9ASPA|nr:hypothetical protein AXF42_Ash018173 [Apostasia shenzhenica]
MNHKMKGLLKGLRYISQIFDEEEEEKEMQIGYPTDVKHVAHIGCDGPSTNAPSWMNEFQSSTANSSKGMCKDMGKLKVSTADSPAKEPPPHSPAKRRHRRRSSNSESPSEAESPARDKESSDRGTRHSRRHASAAAACETQNRDVAADGVGSRRGRRHSKLSGAFPAAGSESPARDISTVPKHSRRRKSKEDGGSASLPAAVAVPADNRARSALL